MTDITPEAIKALREHRGQKQGEFARELGLTQTAVSKLETGARVPTGPLAKLLELLLKRARIT